MSKFRCNQCWEQLKGPTACITPCSHIFCVKDARSWFSTQSECPCCNRTLNRETDLKQIQFEASMQMELWGLPPSNIMDVASSALGFWEYQKDQEIAWHNHTIKQLKAEVVKREKIFKEKMVEVENTMNSMTHQIDSLQDDLKRKKQACEALENDLQEKTRQCRKYEQLYKSLSRNKPPSSPSPAITLVDDGVTSAHPSSSSSNVHGGSSAIYQHQHQLHHTTQHQHQHQHTQQPSVGVFVSPGLTHTSTAMVRPNDKLGLLSAA